MRTLWYFFYTKTVDILANRDCRLSLPFFLLVGIAITQLFRLNASVGESNPAGTWDSFVLHEPMSGVCMPNWVHLLYKIMRPARFCMICRGSLVYKRHLLSSEYRLSSSVHITLE